MIALFVSYMVIAPLSLLNICTEYWRI